MNHKLTAIRMCPGVFAAASLLLTGCVMTGPSRATETQVKATPPPSPGKVAVYVYREPGIVGSSGYSRIYVNGEYLAGLRSGQYARREVPAGTVVFATTPRVGFGVPLLWYLNNLKETEYEKLRVEAQEGQTYFVKWSVGDEMKLMDAGIGAKEMSGLEPAKIGED